MKLAVAIASKNAPPTAFVVWRGFEESIHKAADLGFHGVELALARDTDIDRNQLRRWLERDGLEVSCISTGQVFATLGLYFTHPDENKRKEVLDVFTGLIDLASEFGGLVNVGRSRGFIAEGASKEQTEILFTDTAHRLCDIAAKKNVKIILEPVNRYEINFINSVEEAAKLAQKVGRPELKLMPDVFHMNIEDAQIGATLAKYADLVEYVHFADSNRLAPGWGHLDFEDVFKGLKKASFNGWASIEILPKPDPDSAAAKAAETILPMIEKYNKEIGV